jgi:ABC-2 type transport system permease protein
VNPFTHVVELIRFALYGKLAPVSLVVVAGTTAALLGAAIWAYDPARGFRAARTAGVGD